MKKLTVFVLVLVLSLLLCGCSVPFDATETVTESREFPGILRGIDIDWSSGEVRIAEGCGSSVKITETRGKSTSGKAEYSLENGILSIKYQSGITLFSIDSRFDITIELPSDLTLDELSVDTASGDIILLDISADEISVDTASGKVNADSIYAKVLDIDTSSGEAELTLASVPDKCSMDTASGSVSLTLPADAEFTAEVDTASGDFTCEFPAVKDGDTYICGSGAAKFRFDTASGDISIHKSDK